MTYKYNPKTKGSGIICAIPQSEPCPMKCEDCFFMSGRSYLEPLRENLPNMPTLEQVGSQVVRVNDGGDSMSNQITVIQETAKYPLKFYNTSLVGFLVNSFTEPVVLTINPALMTDKSFHQIVPIPPNLMFVRVRTNMWNLHIVREAVVYYSKREVPIVLTFMAYEWGERIPKLYKHFYTWRKRTTNPYWAITSRAWNSVMEWFGDNKWVYSCGTEGEKGTTLCRFCGNCLREFYATKERMENCDNDVTEKTKEWLGKVYKEKQTWA